MKFETYKALIENLDDEIALLANTSAYLNSLLEDINWIGFYRLISQELVLGPFQGEVACVKIELSKGVCGHVASTQEAIIVDDVHQFPGHIACDHRSNSEMVLPIFIDDQLYGVLDIDSPSFARFTATDLKEMETIVKLLEAQLKQIKNAN